MLHCDRSRPRSGIILLLKKRLGGELGTLSCPLCTEYHFSVKTLPCLFVPLPAVSEFSGCIIHRPLSPAGLFLVSLFLVDSTDFFCGLVGGALSRKVVSMLDVGIW